MPDDPQDHGHGSAEPHAGERKPAAAFSRYIMGQRSPETTGAAPSRPPEQEKWHEREHEANGP